MKPGVWCAMGLLLSTAFASVADSVVVLATDAKAAKASLGVEVPGNPLTGLAIPGAKPHNCLSPELEQAIRAEIEAFRARSGLLSTPSSGSADAIPPYAFYPQGGTLYKDIPTGNFVDLNPATGVLNYLCDTYGNEGHAGCDSGAPYWSQMAIGIPVYAVLPGTVVAVHDGDADMNTFCAAGGNYVILDHGSGRETWYLHFKKGSVAVTLGQTVVAGQQLGLIGSSGCSFGPHLHFQSMQNGSVLEPFTGSCNPGTSAWAFQIDPPPAVYLKDFGVTSQDIGAAPAFPAYPPVNAQMTLADPFLYYWMFIGSLPPNSTWVERYIRPNGTVEGELGPFPFGNTGPMPSALFWFKRNIPGMHTTSGTWRIEFEINGVQVIDAPVEVVPAITPGFNRPPKAVDVNPDPGLPMPGEVIFARIISPAALRDLDWDIVRYRYQWTVNGVTVRDVISAGMADALPSDAAPNVGDDVVCVVTPHDGKVDGIAGGFEVSVGVDLCYPDCDGDTQLTIDDFICFQTLFALGDPFADCDQDTALTIDDFICYQTFFAIGC